MNSSKIFLLAGLLLAPAAFAAPKFTCVSAERLDQAAEAEREHAGRLSAQRHEQRQVQAGHALAHARPGGDEVQRRRLQPVGHPVEGLPRRQEAGNRAVVVVSITESLIPARQ